MKAFVSRWELRRLLPTSFLMLGPSGSQRALEVKPSSTGWQRVRRESSVTGNHIAEVMRIAVVATCHSATASVRHESDPWPGCFCSLFALPSTASRYVRIFMNCYTSLTHVIASVHMYAASSAHCSCSSFRTSSSWVMVNISLAV